MNKKKCLILGAGGFIGRSLCESLRHEYKIVAYDSIFPRKFEQWDDVDCRYGNFVNDRNYNNLLEHIDIVIHLISTTLPIEGTSNIFREIDENVRPTAMLLEAVGKSSVQKFVFSSSGGTVYGETNGSLNNIDSPLNPRNTYGLQKTIIEKMVQFYSQQYSFSARIMRIANPYGIGQDSHKPQGVIPILIRKLFLQEPIDIYGATNTRDYLYMSDLMNAFKKVLSYSGMQNYFNIGTGYNYTVPEIINKIEEASGQSFHSINYFASRSFDIAHSPLNIDSSCKELGWKPLITLDEGILLILDHYKNNLI